MRSKIPPPHNDPVDIFAARNKQRQQQNQMLVDRINRMLFDRIKGVPALPSTEESNADPKNPNA